MASVTLDRLTKAFGSTHTAVRELTLKIDDGELLVLVGPSGCGKSTVLRLIAGLETPTSGRVLIDDEDVTATAPQHRDVAMVFQSYALYPHMTVRQNLGFGLRVRRVPQAAIDAAVKKAAGMLDIAPLLDRRPSQLSGGQRQRVALGRALARNARVYLLDEPLSNLDPLLRVETRTELGLLHRQLGATMVYVTHDQEEAMTLGSRIALMRQGRLEQVGPPLELYRQPATRFVAGFIGAPAMNFAAASASATAGGGLTIHSPVLVRPLTLTARAAPAASIELAFRPHDAEIAADAEADGFGEVAVVEPLGPHTLVHLQSTPVPDARLRLVVPPDVPVRAGDRVGFRLRRDRILLFDTASGARLH
jgi:multiple sugar transport system ATP-binding protein